MSIAAAPISAMVLQVPMTSGAIIRPNSTTSQGVVRQRIREPTMPVRISSG
jgi:hypothetical protein